MQNSGACSDEDTKSYLSILLPSCLSTLIIITQCAKPSGAVYCYQSCLCACLQWACRQSGGVCLCVCGSVTMITRNCVHRSSPNWVWVVKVHLQLIKFWPSRTLGKGVCGGAKIFGSALLQPSRSVCVSLSDFFNVKYFELLTFLQYFDIVCWTSAIPKVCEGKSEFK